MDEPAGRPRQEPAPIDRDGKGRFVRGQSGNPAGGNKSTLRLAEELSGEECRALIRKCFDSAMAGDSRLQVAFLDRLMPAPKGRLLKFPLPISSDPDVAYEQIVAHVAGGMLTATEARDLSEVLTGRARATAVSDLRDRVLAVEERLSTIFGGRDGKQS
jgi:hypothetical protein